MSSSAVIISGASNVRFIEFKSIILSGAPFFGSG